MLIKQLNIHNHLLQQFIYKVQVSQRGIYNLVRQYQCAHLLSFELVHLPYNCHPILSEAALCCQLSGAVVPVVSVMLR